MNNAYDATINLTPDQKRDLLARLIQDRESKPKTSPLSFAQKRLWFLNQLEPGNPFYNTSKALYLKGELDRDVLERSLTEIIKRHETLRTIFAVQMEEPVQVILPRLKIEITSIDLRRIDREARPSEINRVVNEEAGKPFDLSKGPLLRASVLSIGEKEHVLVLVMHHIVSDGWSMTVLSNELTALYGSYSRGEESGLPELELQYADYAEWQRDWLKGDVLERQMSYWREQLRGARGVLELPTDRVRPAVQSYQGATQRYEIRGEIKKKLKQMSQQEGVTQYMLMLAVFNVLLHRYSNQADILVGTPIANRSRVEFEGLIGYVANTVVVRTDLSGEPSFRELLKRIRETVLGAYAHQDLPFEKLVEELQPERSLSHNPLFQVMLIVNKVPNENFALPGLDTHFLTVESTSSIFDLTLWIDDYEESLGATLQYSTALFDDVTISQMIKHFEMLLESAVEDPDQKIGQMQMLTQAETEQLLVEWNRTGTYFPADKCIHELFEHQAAQTPDRVAVVFDGDRITYDQLNRRANQLAHHLRRQAVGAETLVGICVERGIEMVVALLGVLKSGGAYVPLDPAYPKQRLAFMLENAGVGVVVTQQRLLAQMSDTAAKVVPLDGDREVIAGESEDNPTGETRADNLAYVIYTSGSTGVPKGVAIEHHSTAGFLNWAAGAFTREELAGVLASTSICFDLSVFEIFAPLILGGKVLIAENALQLPACAANKEITLINTVPSAIKELVSANSVPDSVCTINLAGEPLQNSLAQQIYGLAHVNQVMNLYGPTEDTTYSTWALVQKGSEEAPKIGRPISGTKVYVVDERLQPVPIGVTGELYLSGEGLARGYFNRPDLTAEKFIPNPFSSSPGAKMYRTGDLARYRADSSIEYLGRVDQQVKVRGYRIELGEIEAVLCQHPGVSEAVVVALEDEEGHKRLVAYIVSKEERSPPASEMRMHLRERLPEYMGPSAYVMMENMPLTANGKLDRRALPVPDSTRPPLEQGYVAARTSDEAIMAGLWARILGVERVGMYDSFFDLGGHSLLAAQLMAGISEAFDVKISLRSIFDAPTIVAQLDIIRTRKDLLALRTPAPLRVPREIRQLKLPS